MLRFRCSQVAKPNTDDHTAPYQCTRVLRISAQHMKCLRAAASLSLKMQFSNLMVFGWRERVIQVGQYVNNVYFTHKGGVNRAGLTRLVCFCPACEICFEGMWNKVIKWKSPGELMLRLSPVFLPLLLLLLSRAHTHTHTHTHECSFHRTPHRFTPHVLNLGGTTSSNCTLKSFSTQDYGASAADLSAVMHCRELLSSAFLCTFRQE